MPYKYENKLRNKASEFLKALRGHGILGEYDKDSFRDYLVKVDIYKGEEFCGTANIYYSPKKDSFTLVSKSLTDEEVKSTVTSLWNKESKLIPEDLNGYHIYVDGSYIDGKTGYGAVILKGGKVIEELSGLVSPEEAGGSRQVAGELKATVESVKWCRRKGLKNVAIHYDYEGIEKWVSGQWKARQPLTKGYAKFIRGSTLCIQWHNVKSHTGNVWNERADALAKQVASAKKVFK